MEIAFREIRHMSIDYHKSVALRQDILRTPLGLKFNSVELLEENNQFHLGAFSGDEVVGILLLKPMADKTDVIKMRQVAVSSNLQSAGIGKGLVNFAESFVTDKGFKKIELHARITAREFYLKLGYETDYIIFEEVSIPHIRMWKYRA
ncbi:MAG: GNAT family N-acetyltransferase [Bacteroidetes bacterium]|nr:GNAT family N-acetyltransferase [Bacteroidota bacterium]